MCNSMLPRRHTLRCSSSEDSSPETSFQELEGIIIMTKPPTAADSGRDTVTDLMTDAEKPCASTELPDSPTLINKSSSLDAGMEALDIGDKKSNRWDKNFNKNFGVDLQTICTSGLHDDVRSQLVQKYLVPPDYQLIKAPILNKEVKETLTLTSINRDMVIETKQNVAAAVLSCLGVAITSLMSENIKSADTVDLLIEAAHLISDCQHKDSLIRRDLVLSATKTEAYELLANTNINNYLFGSNVDDIMNAVKAIKNPAAKSRIPSMNISFTRRTKKRSPRQMKGLEEGHESEWVSRKAKKRPLSAPETRGQEAKVLKLE